MKKISEEILYRGQWLVLKKDKFVNSKNEQVVWEAVERTHNSPSFGIIAKLVPSNRYILIKQFRHAINNYVIGLPAGISGPDVVNAVDLDNCILKELLEETGYSGTIQSKSPALKLNPAIMNSDFLVVSAQVDERSPQNLNVRQRLEPAEDIETILIEQDKIETFLLDQHSKGIDISSAVWFLAHNL
ncbi:MAG: NUDIX hydrolase [Candidatus Omnitrophica bacterium]|nr:NUDIX hydrolase [Candidatus Omnitrophota bacterium]